MGSAEKAALERLGRGILSLIISAIIAYFTKNGTLIATAPLINATGKYLRDKYKLPNIPF
jgi:hypothetical protein